MALGWQTPSPWRRQEAQHSLSERYGEGVSRAFTCLIWPSEREAARECQEAKLHRKSFLGEVSKPRLNYFLVQWQRVNFPLFTPGTLVQKSSDKANLVLIDELSICTRASSSKEPIDVGPDNRYYLGR